MRRNRIGDVYCHTADEARAYIDEHASDGVCVDKIDPPEGEFKACAEVLTNKRGDTVCYIEADTVEAVRAIVVEAGIEIL